VSCVRACVCVCGVCVCSCVLHCCACLCCLCLSLLPVPLCVACSCLCHLCLPLLPVSASVACACLCCLCLSLSLASVSLLRPSLTLFTLMQSFFRNVEPLSLHSFVELLHLSHSLWQVHSYMNLSKSSPDVMIMILWLYQQNTMQQNHPNNQILKYSIHIL
jgi:hypothetical protein